MGNGEWGMKRRRPANDAGDGGLRNRGQDATARAAMNPQPRVLRNWSPIPQRRRSLRKTGPYRTNERKPPVGVEPHRRRRPLHSPFPIPHSRFFLPHSSAKNSFPCLTHNSTTSPPPPPTQATGHT